MASLAEKIISAFRPALETALAEETVAGDSRGDHHVHVHVGDAARPKAKDQEVPAATETVTAENPPPIEQVDQPPVEGRVAGVVARHDDELEELWEANEMERHAIESLLGASGEDAAPRFRDSWPHRDARRARMGIRKGLDQAAPTPLPEGHPEGGTGQSEFEMEAPPGTLDAARRATDSAWMQDSWDETISWAEILVPGLRLPVFDARARPRQTFNTLCAFRARVLDAAYNTPDGREIIDSLELSFPGAGKMSCEAAKRLLKGAANFKGRTNTQSVGGYRPPTVDTMGTSHGGAIPAGPDLAAIQKAWDVRNRSARVQE